MGPAARKICTACGIDVAGKPRVKDVQSNYYCQPCWQARSAIPAAPAVPPAPTAPRATASCSNCRATVSSDQIAFGPNGDYLCPACLRAAAVIPPPVIARPVENRFHDGMAPPANSPPLALPSYARSYKPVSEGKGKSFLFAGGGLGGFYVVLRGVLLLLRAWHNANPEPAPQPQSDPAALEIQHSFDTRQQAIADQRAALAGPGQDRAALAADLLAKERAYQEQQAQASAQRAQQAQQWAQEQQQQQQQRAADMAARSAAAAARYPQNSPGVSPAPAALPPRTFPIKLYTIPAPAGFQEDPHPPVDTKRWTRQAPNRAVQSSYVVAVRNAAAAPAISAPANAPTMQAGALTFTQTSVTSAPGTKTYHWQTNDGPNRIEIVVTLDQFDLPAAAAMNTAVTKIAPIDADEVLANN